MPEQNLDNNCIDSWYSYMFVLKSLHEPIIFISSGSDWFFPFYQNIFVSKIEFSDPRFSVRKSRLDLCNQKLYVILILVRILPGMCEVFL